MINPTHHSAGTNFYIDHDSPRPWLQMLAEAGFTHVHWAHHWKGQMVYDRDTMDKFVQWLKDLDLLVNDIHAAQGAGCGSRIESQRLSALELIRNRIDLAERFSCQVIVLHPPAEPEEPELRPAHLDAVRRSFDSLEPYARRRGVCIALENLPRYNQAFAPIKKLLSWYKPDFLGLCYDSGHGNINTREGKYDFNGEGLDRLEEMADRLRCVHLNDNDGSGDQHLPMFKGTVDWHRLAAIIARSGYRGSCLTWEVIDRTAQVNELPDFLEKIRHGSRVFADLIVDLAKRDY